MNSLSIDFGNCNTVCVCASDGVLSDPLSIPSLIAYPEAGGCLIGDAASAAKAPLFRWMKRYLMLGSPYSLSVRGTRCSAARAAEDFLACLIERFPAFDELVLSVPTESFEPYNNWLITLMEHLTKVPIRLIDETTAAALGCGLRVANGSVLGLFDFGGSTMQVTLVRMEAGGCRVLGKSGCSIGGMTIDRWLYEALSGGAPLPDSAAFLTECTRAKEALSAAPEVPIRAERLTRERFETILEKNGLADSIRRLIRDALRDAEDRGFRQDELLQMIPVGGSCAIPYVRRAIRAALPGIPLAEGNAQTAVAVGAARSACGMQVFDFIQHDYAIRSREPGGEGYIYRSFIPRGTVYPTEGCLISLSIRASSDGQERLGLAVHEISPADDSPAPESEVFFRSDGSVLVTPLSRSEQEAGRNVWLNRDAPLFLPGGDDIRAGEACYRISFAVDRNKMLLLTAEDLRSGAAVYRDHPVVRLN